MKSFGPNTKELPPNEERLAAALARLYHTGLGHLLDWPLAFAFGCGLMLLLAAADDRLGEAHEIHAYWLAQGSYDYFLLIVVLLALGIETWWDYGRSPAPARAVAASFSLSALWIWMHSASLGDVWLTTSVVIVWLVARHVRRPLSLRCSLRDLLLMQAAAVVGVCLVGWAWHFDSTGPTAGEIILDAYTPDGFASKLFDFPRDSWPYLALVVAGAIATREILVERWLRVQRALPRVLGVGVLLASLPLFPWLLMLFARYAGPALTEGAVLFSFLEAASWLVVLAAQAAVLLIWVEVCRTLGVLAPADITAAPHRRHSNLDCQANSLDGKNHATKPKLGE